MFEKRQTAILLVLILFAFISAAGAQSSDCSQKSTANKAPRPCVQRQKPYEVSRPPRTIAPRELPSVSQREAERAAQAAEVVSNVPIPKMIEEETAIAVIPGVK